LSGGEDNNVGSSVPYQEKIIFSPKHLFVAGSPLDKLVNKNPGANPTTFEFTTTTPAWRVFKAGANPTIASYNASVVILYNATGRLVRVVNLKVVGLGPGKIFFILKTRCAVRCVVIFYSAGVVTQGRRIDST
jgi:hypothetical protein